MTGAQGTQGPTGVGATGPQGPQGISGAQGATGPDTYYWEGGPQEQFTIAYNSAGTTDYGAPNGEVSLNATEAAVSQTMPFAGSISSFQAVMEEAGATGFQATFTIRVGATSTAAVATCTPTAVNTVTTCSWSGTVSFSAGAEIDMMVVVTGGTTGAGHDVTDIGWRIQHT